jgi:hypothetical protein
MRRHIVSIVCVTLGAVVAAGCNSVGDCPSAPITAGGSCSTENLQCAYTLPASDDAGTPTSCICTMGTWACPSAPSGDDGGGDASAVGDSTVEAGGDAAPESAADAVAADANSEVGAEASIEASSNEAGIDASTDSAGDAGGG